MQRTRWSAIGAAVAVALGGGGLLGASAGSSDSPSAFTAITPCRIMDTRATSTVGPRPVALGPGETHSITTFGTNGNCTLPSGLTALSLNVTAVGPTADSYLTVFPAGGTVPTASNLNFVANQAPVPNAVTVAVADDGRISFFNNGGNVNVIADVVGYYTKAATKAPAGSSLAFTDYATARYVFTSLGCGPRGLRVVVQNTWGPTGVFSDSPCIDAPVWANETEAGTELLRWQAPLTNVPAGLDQYRIEVVTPFNLTFPTLPSASFISVTCSIVEQGSAIVRCDAAPFLSFMTPYPYDTYPVFQALAGYIPATFTLLTENPPNP